MKRWTLRKRLGALLGFGVVAIALLLTYFHYFLERPIGSGPAGPTVAKEAFNEPWTDEPVLLLGVGDSVTAGLGAKTAAHSYFNRLVKNPDDEFADFETWDWGNLDASQAKTKEMLPGEYVLSGLLRGLTL